MFCCIKNHKLSIGNVVIPLLCFCSPACRRLLFPLLHTEKGRRPFSACGKGNRRRLHAGNVFVSVKIKGSKGGGVVRALASHQCGPGSNPGVDAICGLSLLLVLSFAPRGFSPGTPVFPSP